MVIALCPVRMMATCGQFVVGVNFLGCYPVRAFEPKRQSNRIFEKMVQLDRFAHDVVLCIGLAANAALAVNNGLTAGLVASETRRITPPAHRIRRRRPRRDRHSRVLAGA